MRSVMTSQPQGCHSSDSPGVSALRRPSQGGFADLASVKAAVAVMAIALLVSCGKKETAQAPTPAAAPKTETVTDAKLEAALAQAFAEEPKKTRVAEKDALADEADSIIAKYPGKNAAELLNVPEVNASLKVALTKLGEDKKLQGQINSTVELAAQMKGLDGTPGSARLDLDVTQYNNARKSRLLQAVLSEDPNRIVSFLTQEIGEATPELSYGGADRASNGVSIKEQTPPAAK